MSYDDIVKEVYWAAGFLEGEGSFPWRKAPANQFAIQASQVNPEPLYRLRQHWGGSVYGPIMPKGLKRKPFFAWYLGGPKAASFAMMLYSQMSGVRQEQIKRGLTGWRVAQFSVKVRQTCRHGHSLANARVAKNGRRHCLYCYALRFPTGKIAQDLNSLERTKDNVSLH